MILYSKKKKVCFNSILYDLKNTCNLLESLIVQWQILYLLIYIYIIYNLKNQIKMYI